MPSISVYDLRTTGFRSFMWVDNIPLCTNYQADGDSENGQCLWAECELIEPFWRAVGLFLTTKVRDGASSRGPPTRQLYNGNKTSPRETAMAHVYPCAVLSN